MSEYLLGKQEFPALVKSQLPGSGDKMPCVRNPFPYFLNQADFVLNVLYSNRLVWISPITWVPTSGFFLTLSWLVHFNFQEACKNL